LFLSSDVTLSDFSHCVFHTKPNAVVGERNLGKCICEQPSEMVKLNCRYSARPILYTDTMLAILSKSIAIIDSDTAEKSITDSDSETSKVPPIVSLSLSDNNIRGFPSPEYPCCKSDDDEDRTYNKENCYASALRSTAAFALAVAALSTVAAATTTASLATTAVAGGVPLFRCTTIPIHNNI
jgi:hypothetical protein